jgi:hypothetical protein
MLLPEVLVPKMEDNRVPNGPHPLRQSVVLPCSHIAVDAAGLQTQLSPVTAEILESSLNPGVG